MGPEYIERKLVLSYFKHNKLKLSLCEEKMEK